MQRTLERKIRKAMREYLSLDAAGQDTAESAVKLRRAREELKTFVKETGLRQDNFREQVAGFGRSAASKASWAKRNIEIIANSFFNLGSTEKNVRAYLKEKQIIDFLSSHNIKYIKRISEKEIIVSAGNPRIQSMRKHAIENLENKPDRFNMDIQQAQAFIDTSKITLF